MIGGVLTKVNYFFNKRALCNFSLSLSGRHIIYIAVERKLEVILYFIFYGKISDYSIVPDMIHAVF